VVDRIADEVGDLAKTRKPDDKRDGASGHEGGSAPKPPADSASHPPDGEEDEFDGVKPKPREGGPPQDPGFRIAVDEDPKKKGS
jgi:hypothetical protein